jgi:hypothetical protein
MRTDDNLEALCARLNYNCGDLHEAARYVGLSPHFVFTWIKEDAVAADKIREAQRVGHLGIESELIRRAVTGVEEDVYFKGEVVGTRVVRSDGLLGKLAEAKLADFKKGDEGARMANYGNMQINIMPRAANYEEWLEMKNRTLADRDKETALALPAPVDAEYVEIPADRPLAGLEGLL